MENIWNKFIDFLPTLGITAAIIAVGIALTLLIAFLCKKAFAKKKLDPSLSSFLVNVVRVVCLSIIVIAALSQLGISTTGLIAFFSAALAAVALALKDNISDISSGIIILFTRPFVTGDFIEFGGHMGFVQKIDIVQTKLLTYEDTNIIIPNSKITSNEVNNYTAHPEMRVKIPVPVSYTADVDMTKKVLLDTVKNTPGILTDEAHTPAVRLNNFGESSLDFFIVCWCDFKDYWTVYFTLTEAIKRALDESGIQIPYNQLDVHIVENVSKDEKK